MEIPKLISRLHLHPTCDDFATITSDIPMPNRWHRFWHRVLLGWRWEEIGEEDKQEARNGKVDIPNVA